MKKLSLTQFTKEESQKDYQFIEFIENNKPMAMLVDVSKLYKSSSKTSYRFGLISPNKIHYWFFKKRTVTTNRVKAQAVYVKLKEYCEEKSLGKPFAFKDF